MLCCVDEYRVIGVSKDLSNYIFSSNSEDKKKSNSATENNADEN
jgi:hypothetical protein